MPSSKQSLTENAKSFSLFVKPSSPWYGNEPCWNLHYKVDINDVIKTYLQFYSCKETAANLHTASSSKTPMLIPECSSSVFSVIDSEMSINQDTWDNLPKDILHPRLQAGLQFNTTFLKNISKRAALLEQCLPSLWIGGFRSHTAMYPLQSHRYHLWHIFQQPSSRPKLKLHVGTLAI